MGFRGWDFSTALEIKLYHVRSFRLKAEVSAFLPYGSPHYLLTLDLYNAARYLSLISILLAANSERL